MKQNINEIFKLFLSERKKDLAPRTYSYYEEAMGLLRHCFDGYGYMFLDDEQNKVYDIKFDQGIEFCDQYDPNVLNDGMFSEFLGYFLPKKVVIGLDGAQKICGACLNFYKWLVMNKLITDKELSETVSDLRYIFNDAWKEFNKPFEEGNYF